MRILALETDIEKIKKRFCHDGECVVYQTYYHGLSFFFAIVREIILTTVLLIAGITGVIYGLPILWTIGFLFFIWVVLVLFNVLKAWIDWNYDFIMITTDKVIFIDQTSIFKQEIMPIHIENIGGISTFTQFWDIFPFGGVSVHLKEGRGGEDITKKYVPRAKEVAGKISDVVTKYQRHQYTNPSLSSQPPPSQPPPSQPPPSQPPPSQPAPESSELGGAQDPQ